MQPTLSNAKKEGNVSQFSRSPDRSTLSEGSPLFPGCDLQIRTRLISRNIICNSTSALSHRGDHFRPCLEASSRVHPRTDSGLQTSYPSASRLSQIQLVGKSALCLRSASNKNGICGSITGYGGMPCKVKGP